MTYSASRLTAFALISACEHDLRTIAVTHLMAALSPRELLGEERWSKCILRFEHEWGGTNANFEDLVTYLDFAEIVDLLGQHKQRLTAGLQKMLRDFSSSFQQLAPIRNRVMHCRPMHFGDLAFVLDVAEGLRKSERETFKGTSEALDRVEKDPSFVIGLEIPGDPADAAGKRHNLPIPDFDETGFVGRKDFVDTLTQLCFGPYPVITIVGEGGMGKTALALKVAYDVLDSTKSPFDAVVWSSCKTTMLTAQDIVSIDNAIKDSLRMFREIATHLAGESAGAIDPVDEVLEYLGEFKILLVIDNLETVLDQRILEFMARLPKGSKVLVTSRIGMGAYEYPLKLTKMSGSDGVELLRALAKVRGVQRLVKMPNAELEKHCARMQFNPGWIKWFVAAAQAGKRPEDILANPQTFLQFCMSNVYEYLSVESKNVLEVMVAISGPHSQADLTYLLDLDPQYLQKAIQQLLSTNMVNMVSIPTGTTYQSLYDLSEMAKAYLRHYHPASDKVLFELTRKKNNLIKAGDQMAGLHTGNPYEVNNVRMRTKGDIVPARMLRDAMDMTRETSSNFPAADRKVEAAKILAPDYFEVHRVEAFLHTLQNRMSLAKLSYENALELEPNSPVLRFFYGGCLLRIGHTDEALSQLLAAEEIDPKETKIKIEIARAYLYKHEFDMAREKLDALLTKGGLSSRTQTVIRDMHLQWFQRKADAHSIAREFIEAEKIIFDLKVAFENTPESELDRKCRTRLMRSGVALSRCIKAAIDPNHRRKLIALYLWLQEQSGARPTIVTKFDLTEQVATITNHVGVEIVIRQTNLIPPEDWARLKVGSYVFHESFGNESNNILGVILAH